jgi:CheY-like chemotaxis protein
MHVGIVGPRLSRDIELLTRLSSTHLVTITPLHDARASPAVMDIIDVLVLEANASADAVTGIVTALRQRYPRITLVLVNGGLTQLEIAELFRLGVVDYFAAPWDDALLAERIDVLAARHRADSSTSTTTGERL